ncbi:Las1-like-domain-containing protein [Pisolithus croceorrhizus]|nr:Las1-like-domain-containing protein [Pisolithus croceorrhizus]KAI6169688.1 Las1-like-domain-containing protein [Pisolithus thermaeus]
MRLPRRVPWAHISELEQVCAWIFADGDDLEAKKSAVNRLSAWKATTALPHALESTLAMLVVQLQDRASQPSFSALNLRLAYASAIIRMVNGLVDPLQVGAFARSIASIAAQLGLPPWLVELRHAATHEDLPSLELLREAARESLSWLFHNYFQPALNPSAPPPRSAALRPVAPLLKSYKQLMKTVTRDASLRKRQQGDIDVVMREIERWIAEAMVSADLANNVITWGFDEHSENYRSDTKKRAALEPLCDALFNIGALVPLAKKKRHAPMDPFLPTTSSRAIWGPLLNQLRLHHPAFPSVFISRAVYSLLGNSLQPGSAPEKEAEDSPRGVTYDEYLARWVVWAIQTWEETSEGENQLRKELLLTLSPSLLPGKFASPEKIDILATLLQTVTSGYEELESVASLAFGSTRDVPEETWDSRVLAQMNHRLEILSSFDIAMEDEDEINTVSPGVKHTSLPVAQFTGWTLLDAKSGWNPCPIGVYYQRRGVVEDVPM